MHQRIRDYKCNECGYCFFTKSKLQRHEKAVHVNVRDHRCDECGKGFHTNHYLKYHIKHVHGQEKNYVCKVCEKDFATKEGLKYHVKSAHLKIKDYVCTECDYAASRRSDFAVHMVKVHKMDEQLFKRSKPKVHKNPNAPVVTEKTKAWTNGKKSRSKRYLKEHFTAANEKSKKCPECDLGFSNTRLLARHALDVHQKVLRVNKNPRIAQHESTTKLIKDKLCHFCPYSTAYQHNLKKHMNALNVE